MTHPKKRYVVIAAVSGDHSKIVLLQKQRGPESLLGKWTFPGGHIESSDPTDAAAAQRELLEETGVDAPLELFQRLAVKHHDDREVVFFGVRCDIDGAKTMEVETVLAARLQDCLFQENDLRARSFAPDFPWIMEIVCRSLDGLPRPKSSAPHLGYKPPYAWADWTDSLMAERPHELLNCFPDGRPITIEPMRRNVLRYRYLDTGETITVPNASYNQTYALRAAGIRAEAVAKQTELDRHVILSKGPHPDYKGPAAEQIRDRMRETIRVMKEMADAVERQSVSPKISLGEFRALASASTATADDGGSVRAAPAKARP